MAVFGNNNQTGQTGNTNVRSVTEETLKEVVNMKLNNGTSPSGAVATVNQSLGSLSASNWDATKVMTVIEALVPCLTKTVYQVQRVHTTTLTD